MKTTVCIECLKTYKYEPHNSRGMYCSNKCQGAFQVRWKVVAWLNGKEKGWTGASKQLAAFVRNYLHATRGTACEECGWDTRHPVDSSVLTEVDHIDGDAGNCRPDNLKILCPNCHAMTPTFRVRNKNSTRNRKALVG